MILLNGILENITTRKDRTLKLTFGTQELTPDVSAQLIRLANDFCYLAIKKDDFRNEETAILEAVKSEDELKSSKSQSQRLRGVLFIGWQQKPEGFTEFKDYYQHHTEKIIEHFKSKLDE